jgi:hypothetical protein
MRGGEERRRPGRQQEYEGNSVVELADRLASYTLLPGVCIEAGQLA